jgi:hypothetical protein
MGLAEHFAGGGTTGMLPAFWIKPAAYGADVLSNLTVNLWGDLE